MHIDLLLPLWKLVRYGRGFGIPEHIAEELGQETLMLASRPTTKNKGNPHAYCYKILKHLILKYLRDRNQLPTTSNHLNQTLERIDDDEPVRLLIRREEQKAVNRIRSTLSDNDNKLLDEIVDGKTWKSIAREPNGIPGSDKTIKLRFDALGPRLALLHFSGLPPSD